MRINELLTKLQEFLSQHGDLEIVVLHDLAITEDIWVYVKEKEVWDKTTQTRTPSDDVVYIDTDCVVSDGMY